MKHSIFLTVPEGRTWKEQLRLVHENLPRTTGFSMAAEGVIPQYPNPPETFYAEWDAEISKLGLQPVMMVEYIDKMQFRDHVMTLDEVVEHIQMDLHLAKRLGFGAVRLMHDLPMEAVLKALPTAEELDVCLVNEISHPATILPQKGRRGLECANYLAVIAKTGTRHLKLTVDTALFHDSINDHQLEELVSEWMKLPEKDTKIACQRIKRAFKELSLPEFEAFVWREYAPIIWNLEMFYRVFGVRSVNMPGGNVFGGDAKPEDIYSIYPHMHSLQLTYHKLFPHPVLEGVCHEPAIPYERIVEILKGTLFDGYLISSVYAGHPGGGRETRLIPEDEFVEVNRLQEMIDAFAAQDEGTVRVIGG